MSAPRALRLACLDAEAPPLFSAWSQERGRVGYEPAVADLIAGSLDRVVEWVRVPWADMIPCVQNGTADAVLCGQGITTAREQQVNFTRPYAVFHEGVLVRRGAGVYKANDLRGRRVAAIAGSTNMTLAQTFAGAHPIAFGEDGADDVYADMLAALEAGEVDAVVDDDVVFVPLGDSDERFELAFTVRTGNRWGVGVSKDRPDTLHEIDGALATAIANGSLKHAWRQWMPSLDYPLGGV